MIFDDRNNISTNGSPPLVSVILCSYNAVQFIGEAINSILSQTLNDFELIIIDDGSYDGTRSVIEGFSDSRIRYFPMEKNMGIVYARNYAIDLSRGTYIALMDHDDISHPDRLKFQVEHLKNFDSDICSTFHSELNSSTGKVRKRKSYTKHSDIKALLSVYTPLINPSVMVRKKSLEKCVYKKEYEFAEDYALWCDLALAGEIFSCTPKYLFTYRVHQAQMTQTRLKSNKNLSEFIRRSYIKGLLGEKYESPQKLTFFNRLRIAIPFLRKLNLVIPNISMAANYEIYARYQYRGNGIMTPLIRLERFLVAWMMTLYGSLT